MNCEILQKISEGKTLEQTYEETKAAFIFYSRELLRQYDSNEPLLLFSSDCVRRIFKAEPLPSGKSTYSNNVAKCCLRALLKYNTNLSQHGVAKLVGVTDHSSVASSISMHEHYFKTSKSYAKKAAEVQSLIDQFKEQVKQ